MLHDLVTEHKELIISRCRAKVAKRSSPPPTAREIDHGVAMFLDEMLTQLRLGVTDNAQIGITAKKHGDDLRRQGFTVSQVVHDYGDVCQAITEIAVESNTAISAEDFRKLNSCLDDAIAGAVTEYGRGRPGAPQTAVEDVPIEGLTLELRDTIQTASLAMEVLKSGRVGIAGSTGAVFERTLLNAQELINRLLAEVNSSRLTERPEPGTSATD
jgi:hypothetical protein